jgi:hypothetical protein
MGGRSARRDDPPAILLAFGVVGLPIAWVATSSADYPASRW